MRKITEEQLKQILEDHKDGKRANLRRTSLRKFNLHKANLRDACLTGADLREAFLLGADLSGADLRKADLRFAELTEAKLNEANLHFADIRFSIGNGKEIITIQTPAFHIVMTRDVLAVGCKQYKWEEWASFTEKEMKKMADELDNSKKILNFWKKYSAFLLEAKRLNFGQS